jgi:hypothetical protein
MENTKFNLAPRGYGRSSFRFAEIIQMNRVPVFVYDDYPWVPYNGSAISAETFGFVAGLHVPDRFYANTTKSSKEYVPYNTSSASFNRGMGISLHDLVFYLNDMTEAEYQEKLKLVEQSRRFFTYEGVVEQIKRLIHDPFGTEGGHLTCSMSHPRTERCCDPDVKYLYAHDDIGKRRHLQAGAAYDERRARMKQDRANKMYNIKNRKGRTHANKLVPLV